MDHYYFILIAQELSISKAAKKAFVSQQSLSKYLQRLEDHYGTVLFMRKPRLQLTEAGRIFLHYAQNERTLSQNLKNDLKKLTNPSFSQISFGMNRSLAPKILPEVLPKFSAVYPDTRVNVILNSTRELQSRVISNSLDLLLGSNPYEHPELCYETVSLQKYKLVISEDMLQEYFPSTYPACKQKFSEGVNISDFVHVPFAGTSDAAQDYFIINNFLSSQNVKLNFSINVNYTNIHIALASKNCCACIFSGLYLSFVDEINQKTSNPLEKLNVYDINNFPHGRRMALILSKGRKTLPPPLQFLIKLIKESLNASEETLSDLSTLLQEGLQRFRF